MLANALLPGFLLLSAPNHVSADLEKTLALVPERASAIAVVPSLGRLNEDLGALIDATNQPASVLAGRPIEMFKAAVGFGAEFDESGSMLMWLLNDAGPSGEPGAAFMVPTRNPGGFLESNFTPEGDGWRTSDQLLVYARECPDHVLLSTVRSMADEYEPGRGSARKVHMTQMNLQ